MGVSPSCGPSPDWQLLGIQGGGAATANIVVGGGLRPKARHLRKSKPSPIADIRALDKSEE